MEQNNPDIMTSDGGLLDVMNTIPENPNKAADDALMNFLNPGTPAKPADTKVKEVKEDQAVSEESSEEELETTTDDGAEDETPIVEDDASEEEGEEPSDEDLTEVDYEEAKNFKFPIKIGGEVTYKSLHEIQNQIAQVESAGKASREAKEQLAAAEERVKALDEREAQIDKIDVASSNERELIVLDYQYRALGAQMEQADGNTYKKLDQQRQQIANKFYEVQNDVNTSKEEVAKTIPADVVDLVPSNATTAQIKAIAELKAKAAKWDSYQGKAKTAKPRLQGKKTMVKAGGESEKSRLSKAEIARNKRLKQGVGSHEDTMALLNNMTKAGFKN